MNDEWKVPGAVRDTQSITASWMPAAQRLIDGVTIREILNVPKKHGYLTEIARRSWLDGNDTIDQIFQVVLEPGAISAWHAHADTTDRLFVSYGMCRIVLYDGREDSATRGLVNEFRFGAIRPALVIVPPRVWHGVQNVSSSQMTVLLNLVDRAYEYEDPDHWRVAPDSPEIPFTF